MFVVRLSLRAAMQNKTFLHICYSNSHDVISISIAIFINSPKDIIILKYSHGNPISMGITCPCTPLGLFYSLRISGMNIYRHKNVTHCQTYR